MAEESSNGQLIKILKEKGSLSKDVTDATFNVFTLFKEVLIELEQQLKAEVGSSDNRIKIQYTDRGTFEAEIKTADDVLIFIMHTNVFVFDPSHYAAKSGYVSLNPSRGTCGMISIYNFLSDSFKYERKNDIGQLTARVFVNNDNHFFVEGKKQIGILFNDFAGQVAEKSILKRVVEAALIYALNIDVSVPPFDSMKEITVYEVLAYNMQSATIASKRLGFKFQNDNSSPTDSVE